MAASATVPSRRRLHSICSAVNRLHTAVHATVTIALLFHRATEPTKTPTIPWLLIFSAEIFFFSAWLLRRPLHWFPLRRSPPFSAAKSEVTTAEVPGLDVFVCTADPEKEPVEAVMATVLSAMSLSYPPEKLRLFISDDGGNPATALAAAEVCCFAKVWLPFCRDYGVTELSPESYFGPENAAVDGGRSYGERPSVAETVKEKYEEYKEKVRKITEGSRRSTDHNAVVKVINERPDTGLGCGDPHVPLLVYIAREKRDREPNHFKAGGLNTLLRVSGILSNAPYLLILDCDMNCADPLSAKHAMSYFLDPSISTSLGFVQFPQRFGNISPNDIYDSRHRSFFMVEQEGANALRGPILSGTCVFIKRQALYHNTKGSSIHKISQKVGYSEEYIESVTENHRSTAAANATDNDLLSVASSRYENGTDWGKEVGFVYDSVLEDLSTSFVMHKKGWVSIYCNPQKAQFLGNGVTNLNIMLQQGCRWSTGMLETSVSFLSSPVSAVKGMGFLQFITYLNVAFIPLYFPPLLCFAIVPQLCLINGHPIFPKVSSPMGLLFLFTFVSYVLKEYVDVLSCGGTLGWLVNEWRSWITRSIVCNLYGFIEACMEVTRIKGASFFLTDKVVGDDTKKLYRIGKYDFRVSPRLIMPIVTLTISNFICMIIGIARVTAFGGIDELFLQLCWCFLLFMMSYHVVEGSFLRNDIGCVSVSITVASFMFSICILTLGSFLLSL